MFLGHGNRFVGGHQHTMGNRCHCGVLAVPTRFHERDGKGKVVGNKGEERYLAWLASDERPAHVNPPVMAEIRRAPLIPSVLNPVTQDGKPVTQPDSVTKTCNTCGKPVTGHGKVCNACRQAAYRSRK